MVNNVLQREKRKALRMAGCLFFLLGVSFISRAGTPLNMPVPITDTVPPPNNNAATPAVTATGTNVATTVTNATDGVIKEVPKSKKQVKPIAVNTIAVPPGAIIKPKITVKPIIKIH